MAAIELSAGGMTAASARAVALLDVAQRVVTAKIPGIMFQGTEDPTVVVARTVSAGVVIRALEDPSGIAFELRCHDPVEIAHIREILDLAAGIDYKTQTGRVDVDATTGEVQFTVTCMAMLTVSPAVFQRDLAYHWDIAVVSYQRLLKDLAPKTTS